MSQFHKPRETDYYLRVPTELVVFQEPVLFFFFLDGIKTFFKRESEKRERGEQEREQERKREREKEGATEPARGHRLWLTGQGRPLDGSVTPQSAPGSGWTWTEGLGRKLGG